MNYRVAGYITAYQDPEALLRCISAIRRQSYPVEEIFVVENSVDDTISHIGLDQLLIQHYPENIGISGGLRQAIPWFINQGYDFLWTFDQDSEPEQGCLQTLITHYDELTARGDKIGTLAPKVIDAKTNQVLHGLVFNGYRFSVLTDADIFHSVYECDAVITSGALVPAVAAKATALPHPDLFIDAVDWEYCTNLRDAGFSIVVACDAILMHRYGNSKLVENRFTGKTITINNYSALRYFYLCRNHTYVETRLCKTKPLLVKSIISRLQRLVVMSGKILVYEHNDIASKLWACLSGTCKGLMGNLGKRSQIKSKHT